ncbi:MAG: hypothetical protein ABID71_08875 [Chloroflexota bacterium]
MVKMTRSVAEARLGNVSDEKRFYCQDGRYLKSLKELQEALGQMFEETYHAHANESKNDFSVWVRDVLVDDKLASDLLKSISQALAARAVAERLTWLKSKL